MTMFKNSVRAGIADFALIAGVLLVAVVTSYCDGVGRLLAVDSLDTPPAIRIMAAPRTLRIGARIDRADVEAQLATERYLLSTSGAAGTFDAQSNRLTVVPHVARWPAGTIEWTNGAISKLTGTAGQLLDALPLEAATIVAFEPDSDRVMLQHDVAAEMLIGTPLGHALVASEDGRFWDHAGLNLPRLFLALGQNLLGLPGGGASTLTMQLARTNVLESREKTRIRKLQEIGITWAIERTRTKPEILRAYANSVPLGASGGKQIRGFGAASEIFYGITDLRSLSPIQAAELVALLNQPSIYLGEIRLGHDTRLRRQRNRVLGLMKRQWPERYGVIDLVALERVSVGLAERKREPGLREHAMYFLDHAAKELPRVRRGRVQTTLEPWRQRVAVEEIEQGLNRLERARPGLKSQLQAALVAVDVRTGHIVAMVGGRSYETSQFNRATSSRRQSGSTFKPFVYLTALEQRRDLTPATTIVDAPTTFLFNGRPWRPDNYESDYDGAMTLRLALDRSKNIPAVKVAQMAGLERIARTWQAVTGIAPRAYPSMALGAVEASALELAAAYRMLARGGVVEPLRSVVGTGDARATAPVRVARPESAFLVTDMLRGVFTDGTATSARAAGFTADAAGKTGTTNDSRDAWFVGFTPRLVVAVWVGRDDNAPTGLTGADAALPIWTAFMKRALTADEAALTFEPPPGIVFVDIDPRTGRRAAGSRGARQAFIRGTEPGLAAVTTVEIARR